MTKAACRFRRISNRISYDVLVALHFSFAAHGFEYIRESCNLSYRFFLTIISLCLQTEAIQDGSTWKIAVYKCFKPDQIKCHVTLF